jgi:hypothetical protein
MSPFSSNFTQFSKSWSQVEQSRESPWTKYCWNRAFMERQSRYSSGGWERSLSLEKLHRSFENYLCKDDRDVWTTYSKRPRPPISNHCQSNSFMDDFHLTFAELNIAKYFPPVVPEFQKTSALSVFLRLCHLTQLDLKLWKLLQVLNL